LRIAANGIRMVKTNDRTQFQYVSGGAGFRQREFAGAGPAQ
jgi:hypothetical protein